ncbi:MAG: hypothetical protein CMJ52_06240 [Planctomycetaceae bacterium]|nr:hypothetical protein [Planctomycetaceae bacterium]
MIGGPRLLGSIRLPPRVPEADPRLREVPPSFLPTVVEFDRPFERGPRHHRPARLEQRDAQAEM